MKALLVTCSTAGWTLLEKLQRTWKEQEPETELISAVKCASLPELSEKESLTACVGKHFFSVDAIIFLCACGIAVRSIAPWITHKAKDPAVIVMDETAKFCIPLLSGHWGGANELAEKLSRMTGAIPVLTTATDREEKFAVDVFARKNDLTLTDWNLAKRISAGILEGERIGFYSEVAVSGEMPKELFALPESSHASSEPPLALSEPQFELSEAPCIVISSRSAARRLFPSELLLVPRDVVVGIGCKRGTGKGKIEAAIGQCLEKAGICPEAVCALASIDLKREEAGCLSWCGEKELPFLTFSAEALGRVPGDFSGSAFVESVTGVSNVCERSAVLAAQGRLLCGKQIYDGVTVALAQKKVGVRF